MDYFRTPDNSQDFYSKEEYQNSDIGGLEVPPGHVEYDREQEMLRNERLRKFLKDHNVQHKVVSDFEERVSMLNKQVSDGKAELLLLLKILNPNTHMTTKLEEHGPLLGILPASLYAVLTPLLVGIPKAAIFAPREIHKIMKNKEAMAELMIQGPGEEDGEEKQMRDTTVAMSRINQELSGIGELLIAYDLSERFDTHISQ